MKHLTLVKTEIEIYPNENDLLYNIYWSSDLQIFIAICITDPSGIFGYKLTLSKEKIVKKHRNEILDYCLGKNNYDKEEDVNIGDIFLWDGDYLESIF